MGPTARSPTSAGQVHFPWRIESSLVMQGLLLLHAISELRLSALTSEERAEVQSKGEHLKHAFGLSYSKVTVRLPAGSALRLKSNTKSRQFHNDWATNYPD